MINSLDTLAFPTITGLKNLNLDSLNAGSIDVENIDGDKFTIETIEAVDVQVDNELELTNTGFIIVGKGTLTEVIVTDDEIKFLAGMSSNIQNQINQIDTDTSAIANAVASNTTDISNNSTSITNLGTTVNNNTNRIVATEGRLTTNEGDILSNSSRITSTEGRLTTNEGNINSNLIAIGNNTLFSVNNSSRITSTEGRLTTNEGVILNNTNRIVATEGRLTTNEGAISSNSSRITSTEGRLTTNEGAISSNSSRLTTNESDISSNSSRLTTNESAISSNSSRITSTEGRITANEGDIISNESNISSNSTDITTLENKTVNLSVVGGNTINQGALIINKDGNYLKTVGNHSWIGAYKDDGTRHYYIGSETTNSNNLLINNEKTGGDLILISSRDLKLQATGSITLNNDLKFPDNTIQQTAFTNVIDAQIVTNTNGIQNNLNNINSNNVDIQNNLNSINTSIANINSNDVDITAINNRYTAPANRLRLTYPIDWAIVTRSLVYAINTTYGPTPHSYKVNASAYFNNGSWFGPAGQYEVRLDVNFQSKQSRIVNFQHRIVVKRANSTIAGTTLYTGIKNMPNLGQYYYNGVNHSTSIIINIEAGYQFFIETDEFIYTGANYTSMDVDFIMTQLG